MIDEPLAPSCPTFPALDVGRVAAWAVTLLLHLLLVIFLLQKLPVQADGFHEDTIDLRDFHRPAAIKGESIKAETNEPFIKQRDRRLEVVSIVMVAPEIEVVAPAHAQNASSLSASTSTLDLSIKEPDVAISLPDPLKRPGKRWEASVPRMQLRMVDSSDR